MESIKDRKNLWQSLLIDAITKPGTIHQAYSNFWNYSAGNQMLAYSQCKVRGIQPSPMATYKRWQELDRQVKQGEKGLTLCLPVMRKGIKDKKDQQGNITKEEYKYTWFTFKSYWFALSQTTGDTMPDIKIPAWDKDKALSNLEITQIDFIDTDGNTLGYAKDRTIAISPLSPLPHKTLFHELAHVLLGHTDKTELNESKDIPRNLREVEAESVALICCESLQLEGIEFSRGYIQNWISTDKIPEKSAQRIFSVSDKTLKAGTKNKASKDIDNNRQD